MASTERKYDLYGPELRADPACVFAQMREHDPVVRQPGIDGETPIWFVARHDDVTAVLLDDEHFVRDPRNALSAEALEERNAAFALAWPHYRWPGSAYNGSTTNVRPSSAWTITSSPTSAPGSQRACQSSPPSRT
jgi:hypothetical protein